MTTENKPQDWSPEPWEEVTHESNGTPVNGTNHKRAVACVNALAGIPDPQDFMEAVRVLVKTTTEVIRQYENVRVAEGYPTRYSTSTIVARKAIARLRKAGG